MTMTSLYTVIAAVATILCVATIVCMLNSLRHSRLSTTLAANMAFAVDNPAEALAAVHHHAEAARSSRSLAFTMLGADLVVALAPAVVALVA